ncbi:MAG: cellulase family glycosylhydrolase [Anaerolineae bacterium]
MLLRLLLRAVMIVALLALLNAVIVVHPPRPLVPCPDDGETPALREYNPTATAEFITLRDRQFYAGETPYVVRGVNYYPANSPWRRFLTDTSVDTVRAELDLLRGAGLNTLRLFLWYPPLFVCDGPTPAVGAFTVLDNVLHEAAARGFRLIVTLHDLPDLRDYPLYDAPPHTQAQTAFIIQRYHDERAILAWDVRNEGDIDYGSNNVLGGGFARPVVLEWLRTTAEQIRALDSQHLLTAGWLHDAWSTAGFVDFVSFHHWQDSARLQERLAEIRRHTDKPVLLEEFGYSTFVVTPEEQARLIAETRQAVEDAGLLGWLIWTAFDFPLSATCLPSPCVSADNAEHHFGLWYADHAPKPAVAAIQWSSP